MGKFRENPRYNVVSLRVSDQEMKLLEKLRGEGKKKKSRGDIMRACIFGTSKDEA